MGTQDERLIRAERAVLRAMAEETRRYRISLRLKQGVAKVTATLTLPSPSRAPISALQVSQPMGDQPQEAHPLTRPGPSAGSLAVLA